MDERDARDYLIEWIKREMPEIVERDLKVVGKDKAISIIGPRRAGKTYYLYQLMKGRRKETVYLNFEDVRFQGINARDILELIRMHIDLSGTEPRYIFLDEVQNVPNWEIAVRTLLDRGKHEIYLTGSSSRLLSREIATSMRGRSLTYLLLPFSYGEFLRAKGILIEEPLTEDEGSMLRYKLREYLEWGGYPEVVLKGERERILREYVDMILFRDFVERHSLKNIRLARYLLETFLQNFAKEFSVHRIAKKMESMGLRFGKNTLYDYVNKIQDTVAIFFLRRYDAKVHVRESWPQKVYLCDTGISKVVRFSLDLGKLMENSVFLELMRRRNEEPLIDLYYFKNRDYEIDFVVKKADRIIELIQVTYASGKDEVDRREIKSLIKGSSLFNCHNLIVITWDYEDTREEEGVKIKYVPLWKYLLPLRC